MPRAQVGVELAGLAAHGRQVTRLNAPIGCGAAISAVAVCGGAGLYGCGGSRLWYGREGPGAAAPAAEVHGFPAALTRFVGREEAVRDVAGLLEEFRLVTVTGPGGMGKTRLAGQVARQVAARFTDGAWLAELAPVRDPAQVAAVVAAALGIQEQSGTPLADTLAQALAGQQLLLLVVDNCEHVLGTASAPSARTWTGYGTRPAAAAAPT